MWSHDNRPPMVLVESDLNSVQVSYNETHLHSRLHFGMFSGLNSEGGLKFMGGINIEWSL